MERLESKFEIGHRVVITGHSDSIEEVMGSKVELVPQACPDLDSLKLFEVAIRVESAAVSWVDLMMFLGQYQHLPKLPYTPGLEMSGVVIGVGAGVKSVQVGEAVYVDCFESGPRTGQDYQTAGGMAGYAVVPVKAVHSLPGALTLDQACGFAGNYETAYHCLVARGQLRSNETILIHGASGATGMAAVQIAKCIGARVLATGRSQRKLDVVKAQGADHVLCLGYDEPNGSIKSLRDQVKLLTNGRGVDVVFDPVGGDISAESLRCLRFGGRLLVVGWAATPFAKRSSATPGVSAVNTLPTNLILMKGLDILGCPAVISAQKNPSIRRIRQEALQHWVQSGGLKPYVSHSFPMSQVREALLSKWNGEVIGGCVVHPWK